MTAHQVDRQRQPFRLPRVIQRIQCGVRTISARIRDHDRPSIVRYFSISRVWIELVKKGRDREDGVETAVRAVHWRVIKESETRRKESSKKNARCDVSLSGRVLVVSTDILVSIISRDAIHLLDWTAAVARALERHREL